MSKHLSDDEIGDIVFETAEKVGREIMSKEIQATEDDLMAGISCNCRAIAVALASARAEERQKERERMRVIINKLHEQRKKCLALEPQYRWGFAGACEEIAEKIWKGG